MTSIARRSLCVVLAAVCVPASPLLSPTQETKVPSLKPIQIAELCQRADLVASVLILSSDAEHYPAGVYKAEVLRAVKGTERGSIIYFGPYLGYGLGEEFLLISHHYSKPFEMRQSTQPSGLSYGRIENLYYVSHGGEGALHVQCQAIGKEAKSKKRCVKAVRVNRRLVLLPDSLKTHRFARGGTEEEARWVRMDSLLEYLERTISDGSNLATNQTADEPKREVPE
jgi:hypothetical protein